MTNGKLQRAKALEGVIPPYTFCQVSSRVSDTPRIADIDMGAGSNYNGRVLGYETVKNYTLYVDDFTNSQLGRVIKYDYDTDSISLLYTFTLSGFSSFCVYNDWIMIIRCVGNNVYFDVYDVTDEQLVLIRQSVLSVGSSSSTCNFSACKLYDTDTIVATWQQASYDGTMSAATYLRSFKFNEKTGEVTLFGAAMTFITSAYYDQLTAVAPISADRFVFAASGFWGDNTYISDIVCLMSVNDSGNLSELGRLRFSKSSTSSSYQMDNKLIALNRNVFVYRGQYDSNQYGVFVFRADANTITQTWYTTFDSTSSNNKSIFPIKLAGNAFWIAGIQGSLKAVGGWYNVQPSGAVTPGGRFEYIGNNGTPTSGNKTEGIVCGNRVLVFNGCYKRSGTKFAYCMACALVREGSIPTSTALEGILMSKATDKNEGKFWVFDATKTINTLAVPANYIDEIKNQSIREVQLEVKNNADTETTGAGDLT